LSHVTFAAVAATVLTIWPASGQEVPPKLPAAEGVCFYIRVVPKTVQIDGAMVFGESENLQNPDKGMLLPPSSPICEHSAKNPPAQESITVVPDKNLSLEPGLGKVKPGVKSGAGTGSSERRGQPKK
jgi:hypothetical protein